MVALCARLSSGDGETQLSIRALVPLRPSALSGVGAHGTAALLFGVDDLPFALGSVPPGAVCSLTYILTFGLVL
jgi:hypothetical protein